MHAQKFDWARGLGAEGGRVFTPPSPAKLFDLNVYASNAVAFAEPAFRKALRHGRVPVVA